MKEYNISRNAMILEEWDKARADVRKGLERLGHDIPLAGYRYEDELREMRERRKAGRV